MTPLTDWGQPPSPGYPLYRQAETTNCAAADPPIAAVAQSFSSFVAVDPAGASVLTMADHPLMLLLLRDAYRQSFGRYCPRSKTKLFHSGVVNN
jgi:hypothetical protein